MRFAIKALGDETSQLLDVVRPGMPAVIGGPFGRFSHEKGTSRQLWIAGGIGVTPFLSWLRALDTHPLRGRVDFFYTSASANPPYAAEIRALADRHDMVHVHLVNSSSEGHLTTERVLATADGSPDTLSVFICGPAGMVRNLQTGFRPQAWPAATSTTSISTCAEPGHANRTGCSVRPSGRRTGRRPERVIGDLASLASAATMWWSRPGHCHANQNTNYYVKYCISIQMTNARYSADPEVGR
jgi:NAD(P)H-flavin reductase